MASISELYTELDGVIAEMEGVAEGNFEGTDEDLAAKSADLQGRADKLKDAIKSRQELQSKTGEYQTALRQLREITKPFLHSPGGSPAGNHAGAVKSLGDILVESRAYKSYAKGQSFRVEDTEHDPRAYLKATLDSSTVPQFQLLPGIVTVGVQRLTVADLLASGQTNSPTIRYIRETSYTNAATTVAEGAAKPQATWALQEIDAPVRKVAVTSKVTDEIFEDFAAVRSYVNERMTYSVQSTLESQLLNGNGTAPNLTGIYATSGILTQDVGTTTPDPLPDAIFKAITQVRATGHFEPDGVVMNPLDWEKIRLLRTTVGDYILGSPVFDSLPRMFNLPVVLTTAQATGTALVGAFKLGAQVFYRQGITLEATNSNEDDFTHNLIALRSELRCSLAVYRAKAFCKVINIA